MPLSINQIKAVGLLVIFAMIGLAAFLAVRYEREQGAAAVVKAQDEADLKASEANRIEDARRVAAQKENANETQRMDARSLAARQMDADRLAAVNEQLRKHAAVALSAAASSSAAAGQCQATASAFAELFGQCRAAYADLGRQADAALGDARARGLECEADYGVLTPAR